MKNYKPMPQQTMQPIARQLPSQSYHPSPVVSEWEMTKELARMMISTQFLPKGLATPEQVVFFIMKGKEMGMGPMQSVESFELIQGKLTMKPEAMLAQVFKFAPNTKLKYLQNDDKACIIEVTKTGQTNVISFSMEDAQRAGLATKDNWKKYPRAMLRSRAVSEMCRSLFPEAIQGCYTAEELDSIETDLKERPFPHNGLPSDANPGDKFVKLEFQEDGSITGTQIQPLVNRELQILALETSLREHSVAESEWAKVKERMKGRTLKELQNVLNEIEQEAFKDPMED